MGQDVPLLEEAVQLMQDVPKQANDAMALSMIVGYHGNIHANGQIVLQVRNFMCGFTMLRLYVCTLWNPFCKYLLSLLLASQFLLHFRVPFQLQLFCKHI